jgi:hypothetical protein
VSPFFTKILLQTEASVAHAPLRSAASTGPQNALQLAAQIVKSIVRMIFIVIVLFPTILKIRLFFLASRSQARLISSKLAQRKARIGFTPGYKLSVGLARQA